MKKKKILNIRILKRVYGDVFLLILWQNKLVLELTHYQLEHVIKDGILMIVQSQIMDQGGKIHIFC